jgi:sigma-E factor negative regulatory protein RseA
VTQEQIDSQLSASQLSAMFDGELPAAECELLSRRLDRDEKLRARWSRYALIGAAMRSEPVATARSGFASRVGAALDAELLGTDPLGVDYRAASSAIRVARSPNATRPPNSKSVWNTAVAASMVAAVAGVSIALLRYSAPAGTTARVVLPVMATTAPVIVASTAAAATAGSAAAAPTERAVGMRPAAVSNGEPRSYVTPINQAGSGIGLQTQLADYMVAHSEYSTPLMRRSLLSALVSSEDAADVPVSRAVISHAGQTDAMPAASAAAH